MPEHNATKEQMIRSADTRRRVKELRKGPRILKKLADFLSFLFVIRVNPSSQPWPSIFIFDVLRFPSI